MNAIIFVHLTSFTGVRRLRLKAIIFKNRSEISTNIALLIIKWNISTVNWKPCFLRVKQHEFEALTCPVTVVLLRVLPPQLSSRCWSSGRSGLIYAVTFGSRQKPTQPAIFNDTSHKTTWNSSGGLNPFGCRICVSQRWLKKLLWWRMRLSVRCNSVKLKRVRCRLSEPSNSDLDLSGSWCYSDT